MALAQPALAPGCRLGPELQAVQQADGFAGLLAYLARPVSVTFDCKSPRLITMPPHMQAQALVALAAAAGDNALRAHDSMALQTLLASLHSGSSTLAPMAAKIASLLAQHYGMQWEELHPQQAARNSALLAFRRHYYVTVHDACMRHYACRFMLHVCTPQLLR